MRSSASDPEGYIEELPEARKEAIKRLRELICTRLPDGFEETMSYGMISYVVPHSIYPAGYHCRPEEPLPFISIASQKNFIAFYHMGLYSMSALNEWFWEAYPTHSRRKPDAGKSCLRFKKEADIPYELLGELCSKVKPEEWIAHYEKNIKLK